MTKTNTCYLVDEGILLSKNDEEYDYYTNCYENTDYGFFDECVYYETAESKAIAEATEYVEKGVEGTYAIVTSQEVTDDIIEHDDIASANTLDASLIVFSIAKINGELVKDFMTK